MTALKKNCYDIIIWQKYLIQACVSDGLAKYHRMQPSTSSSWTWATGVGRNQVIVADHASPLLDGHSQSQTQTKQNEPSHCGAIHGLSLVRDAWLSHTRRTANGNRERERRGKKQTAPQNYWVQNTVSWSYLPCLWLYNGPDWVGWESKTLRTLLSSLLTLFL